MFRWIALISIVLVVGNGCEKSSDSATGDSSAEMQASNSAQVFSDNVADFTVKVFYEPAAAPYVGNIGLTTSPTWDITKTSYQALFQNHVGRYVFVPSTLGQMSTLAVQGKGMWSSSELIELGRRTAPPLMDGQHATVSVIFLNGTYNGDGSILGIQFTGFPFVFVFKDVVVSVGGDSVAQRYAEQATVVHEVGHAVGLVNNGVPMIVAHDDHDHPHHSTNSACVMYWAIEAKGSILTSLASLIAGNQKQLFGAQSLQDGRSYHPF